MAGTAYSLLCGMNEGKRSRFNSCRPILRCSAQHGLFAAGLVAATFTRSHTNQVLASAARSAQQKSCSAGQRNTRCLRNRAGHKSHSVQTRIHDGAHYPQSRKKRTRHFTIKRLGRQTLAKAEQKQKRTLSPTAALPCFTASMAYSIWKMRPCGLHVVTSVSYCTADWRGSGSEGASCGGQAAAGGGGGGGPARRPVGHRAPQTTCGTAAARLKRRGSHKGGLWASAIIALTWFLNILPLRRSRPPLLHCRSRSAARPGAQAVSSCGRRRGPAS